MATKRDMEQWAVERYGITPIEFMMGVMVNPSNSQYDRMDAAKAAAPYMHPKLRQTEIRETPAERTHEELEHDVTSILEKYVQQSTAGPAPDALPRGPRDLVGLVPPEPDA